MDTKFGTLTQYKLYQLVQMCLWPRMKNFAVEGFSTRAGALSEPF